MPVSKRKPEAKYCSCVKKLKAKVKAKSNAKSKVNPFAVCRASIKGLKGKGKIKCKDKL